MNADARAPASPLAEWRDARGNRVLAPAGIGGLSTVFKGTGCTLEIDARARLGSVTVEFHGSNAHCRIGAGGPDGSFTALIRLGQDCRVEVGAGSPPPPAPSWPPAKAPAWCLATTACSPPTCSCAPTMRTRSSTSTPGSGSIRPRTSTSARTYGWPTGSAAWAAPERRAQIDALYRRLLAGIPGLRCLRAPAGVEGNHAYFPVMVGDEFPLQRDELYQRMRDQQVLVRRYFYPLISEFPMYRGLPSAAAGNLPVASAAARRVLCLPIHPGLGDADVERICALVAAPARVRAA